MLSVDSCWRFQTSKGEGMLGIGYSVQRLFSGVNWGDCAADRRLFCRLRGRLDPCSIAAATLLYPACGRTNKQRDINFLQPLRRSAVTFMAGK